jgi:outer membrane protein TolC
MQPDYQNAIRSTDKESVTIPDDLKPAAEGQVPAGMEELGEGDVLRLSREQATMFALQQNRQLQVELLNPVIAGTFEEIERGVYDPELFAELGYSREVSSETSRSTGEQFDVDANEAGGGVGIRQRVPTGTDLAVSVTQDRSISNRAPEQQEARVGLSVTQSLLRGFGPAVNLASVRQAELEAEASLYELRGFVQAIVGETEIAYWRYVLARQEIDIFERSLEIAERQRDEVEARIEVGTLAENEAAAARTEVALNQQALINAQSGLEERRLRLLRLMNFSPISGSDVTIEPVSEPETDAKPADDIEGRLQLASRSRPDLNEARLRLEQDRLETVVTRNGLLPRLDLFADLGQTGFSDTFDGSFRELKEFDTYDYSVGIQLSHYIGNRAARARDLAARASRRQAAEAVANLAQNIELEVLLAVNEVERTRQRIAATRASRLLQEQTYRAERERFDVGASTSLLVSQAQRDLLAIRIQEVEAVIEYRIALVELYLAEGSLLQRRGIQLPDGGFEQRYAGE